MGIREKRIVIIDQDAFGPGGDAVESIAMLLQDTSVQVLGITIESAR